MKKIILLMLILCRINVTAQYKKHSVEVGLGINYHVSPLDNANIGLHGNVLYRYNVGPKFGIGLLGSYDTLTNNHSECEYDEKAFNITPEVFYRFLRRDNWAVIGHTGVGFSKLGQENLLNYVIGGTILRKITGNIAAKLGYIGTSYVYQTNALDNFTPINSNGINSYTNQIFAGIAYRFGRGGTHADFYKDEPKQEIIRELEIRTEKETVIQQIVERKAQRIAVPNEFVFFKEGKTNIEKEELGAIMRIYEFMLLHPAYKLAIVGSSCGGHGSFERNLELSVIRAKNVFDKLGSLGMSSDRMSHRGVGVDKLFKHQDQDVQKRVELILYTTKK